MAMPPPQANPMQMLQQLLKGGVGQGYSQPDPRAGAIEQYMAQQGQQSNMPVRPPAAQQEMSINANPNAIMDDQGKYPGDDDDEQQAKEQSDEEMLAHVHDQMDGDGKGATGPTTGSIDELDPKEHEMDYLRSLPPRAQQQYLEFVDENDGKAPATDSEMDAAFGKGATERNMGGVDPYDRGFLKEDDRGNDITQFRKRRRNEPPSDRFPEQMDPYQGR